MLLYWTPRLLAAVALSVILICSLLALPVLSSTFLTQALIYVIDPWDNDILKAEPSLNKNFANIDLFDRVPFYPTFLQNTWHLAAKEQGDDHRLVGVVPLR